MTNTYMRFGIQAYVYVLCLYNRVIWVDVEKHTVTGLMNKLPAFFLTRRSVNRLHSSRLLEHVLSRMSPVHTHTSYLHYILFNIIIPYSPESSSDIVRTDNFFFRFVGSAVSLPSTYSEQLYIMPWNEKGSRNDRNLQRNFLLSEYAGWNRQNTSYLEICPILQCFR
jgi:hypothetical protein